MADRIAITDPLVGADRCPASATGHRPVVAPASSMVRTSPGCIYAVPTASSRTLTSTPERAFSHSARATSSAMSADVDRSVVAAGAYHWHATAAAHGVPSAGHRAPSLDPGAASAGFVGVANASSEGAARRRIDRQAITAGGGSAATSGTWRWFRAARRRRWFPALAPQLLELLAQLFGLGHRSFAALRCALFAASVRFSPSDLIRPQLLLLGVAARRHSSRQGECSHPTQHRMGDKPTTTSCHIRPLLYRPPSPHRPSVKPDTRVATQPRPAVGDHGLYATAISTCRCRVRGRAPPRACPSAGRRAPVGQRVALLLET